MVSELWTDKQRARYIENRDWLWQNCNYNCKASGRDVIPHLSGVKNDTDSYVDIRYQSDVDEVIWDQAPWYIFPEN